MSGRRPVVLITGAAGFVGRHACAWFAAQGYEVAALVRRAGSAPQGTSELRGDLDDPLAVRALVRAARPDYALHLAGANAVRRSWEEPLAYFRTNLMGTLHLLDAVRRSGRACRVLVVGSLLDAPSGDPGAAAHPYSLSKTVQAGVSLAWGGLFEQEVLLAQPSNLIGPGESAGICALLARYAAGLERGEALPPFRLSSRGEPRDYLDVRDAVRACARLLREGRPGLAYPIGSGAMRSLGEVCDTVERLARVPLPIRITGTTSQTQPARRPDLTQLRALGWRPEIPFERSIADTLEYARRVV
ncbi:NAD-dependent epimerase/dehydratase family protein [Paenibacillus sp. IB182496]|uniref:NAD-dependent epimerase/dehydratase family protein n=1 Tax=Paenibacillus sabuli TaxID=2772509 RepID=A0A927BVC8_9BACL|nr:NAD-dependent epimerase/dehydratase family protein [Paenibacillus sabuli]MBD2846425.1 NAD-dependent epimerase/dehydratase family protein [Paenibacillus sabuli]